MQDGCPRIQCMEEIWENMGKYARTCDDFITTRWLPYQVLKTHIWWNPNIKGIGYGISNNQGAKFDRKALSYVRKWEFKLNNRESQAIETLTKYIPNQWLSIIQHGNIQASIGSWVWSFEFNDQDTHPTVTFQSGKFFRPILVVCSWNPFPPPTLKCFHILINTPYHRYKYTVTNC